MRSFPTYAGGRLMGGRGQERAVSASVLVTLTMRIFFMGQALTSAISASTDDTVCRESQGLNITYNCWQSAKNMNLAFE